MLNVIILFLKVRLCVKKLKKIFYVKCQDMVKKGFGTSFPWIESLGALELSSPALFNSVSYIWNSELAYFVRFFISFPGFSWYLDIPSFLYSQYKCKYMKNSNTVGEIGRYSDIVIIRYIEGGGRTSINKYIQKILRVGWIKY